ncbi:MAG: kelch motif-containing protein [Acidobacteria bacterium]|nr:kelch motif-containing protein [Acidobacteriota bacterium]
MNKPGFIHIFAWLFALAIVTMTAPSNIVSAQAPDWQWRELTVLGQKPEARRNGVAIYDPVAKRVIIFGGASNSGSLNDTWAFSLETRMWTRLATVGTPPEIALHQQPRVPRRISARLSQHRRNRDSRRRRNPDQPRAQHPE